MALSTHLEVSVSLLSRLLALRGTVASTCGEVNACSNISRCCGNLGTLDLLGPWAAIILVARLWALEEKESLAVTGPAPLAPAFDGLDSRITRRVATSSSSHRPSSLGRHRQPHFDVTAVGIHGLRNIWQAVGIRCIAFVGRLCRLGCTLHLPHSQFRSQSPSRNRPTR